MTKHSLTLAVRSDRFAVGKLSAQAPIPPWASSGDFFSITRTADELSLVCPEQSVPEGTRCEKGWRCLRVAGTLDFSVVGVLAALVTPLAEAGISLFALSTFDTDYLLVKEKDLAKALAVLQAAGHEVHLGSMHAVDLL